MAPGRSLTVADIAAFDTEMKLAFVATKDPEGRPHVALITSLQARGPEHMMFGEFIRGRTKAHVRSDPEVAWAVITLDKGLWRGRARWTGLATSGPDYDMFNDRPMFRYNAYFGIHTVHYLDLVEAHPREALPMARIVPAALLTRVLRSLEGQRTDTPAMNPFTTGLFNQMDALKLLAWVDDGGWPRLVPVVQCQAADPGRLVFSTLAWGDELRAVPAGDTVAVFAANTKMESVLVRGRLSFRRRLGVPYGAVDVDWVYNSMPPAHGQIFPPVPLKPVTHF
ncbi:MAG: hypothetical protein ABIK09_08910 [Pseudomonadota bacterium]